MTTNKPKLITRCANVDAPTTDLRINCYICGNYDGLGQCPECRTAICNGCFAENSAEEGWCPVCAARGRLNTGVRREDVCTLERTDGTKYVRRLTHLLAEGYRCTCPECGSHLKKMSKAADACSGRAELSFWCHQCDITYPSASIVQAPEVFLTDANPAKCVDLKLIGRKYVVTNKNKTAALKKLLLHFDFECPYDKTKLNNVTSEQSTEMNFQCPCCGTQFNQTTLLHAYEDTITAKDKLNLRILQLIIYHWDQAFALCPTYAKQCEMKVFGGAVTTYCADCDISWPEEDMASTILKNKKFCCLYCPKDQTKVVAKTELVKCDTCDWSQSLAEIKTVLIDCLERASGAADLRPLILPSGDSENNVTIFFAKSFKAEATENKEYAIEGSMKTDRQSTAKSRSVKTTNTK